MGNVLLTDIIREIMPYEITSDTMSFTGRRPVHIFQIKYELVTYGLVATDIVPVTA